MVYAFRETNISKIQKSKTTKQNVNPSNRVGMARLLLGISDGLHPQEIPWSSPASPGKTPFIPPLLLGLTQYLPILANIGLNFYPFSVTVTVRVFNRPGVAGAVL